ncbi:hypothetical protein AADZ86_10200 [Colwelliaceae bacterium BS250]
MKLKIILLLIVAPTMMLTNKVQSSQISPVLTNNEQQALAVGLAIARVNSLGKAGAPLMTNTQISELEKNIEFLSSDPSTHKMAWAWLEFRIKNDSQLTLKNNPSSDAIKQRLDLFPKLLRKYFVFE